jgi:hypothetical protein
MTKNLEQQPNPLKQQLISTHQADTQQKEGLLAVAQYEQLHEMRREYNRFIFQAPTIVVTVAGASLAVLPFILGGNLTRAIGLVVAAVLFISISGFTFVLGYWALRSQVLLRATEKTLKRMEKTYGHPDMLMYPYEVSPELPRWQRGPSTRFIVYYIFIIGFSFLIIGAIGLFFQH